MADVAATAGCPSCTKMKEKYNKTVKNRNALRQAVKLVNNGFEELQKKYDQLQKDYQDAHMQTKLEKEAKDKELALKITLEQELLVLKDQLSKYQQKESSDTVEVQENNLMLDSCISEKEAEIKRLEELLVNEKKKVHLEKKKVEAEKKKVEEERKLLEIQKKVAEDQKRLAETERNRAAKLESSFDRLKIQLEEERSKAHSYETAIAEEKQKTARESIQANREMEKAKVISKALEEERKKTRNQKVNIDNLKKQLDNEKQKREAFEKTARESIPADREMEKAKCISKALEEERKKTRDQKVDIDNLKKQLDNEKKKREVIEKKLLEFNSTRETSFNDSTLKDLLSNEKSTVKLLQGRIKLEKTRSRLARRKARLEKAEKLFLGKQLHLLKQDHIGLSYQLKMLGEQVSQRVTGTLSQAKHVDFGHKYSKGNIQASHPCNCFCFPTKEDIHCACISLKPGAIAEFNHPTVGSEQKKLQNSTVCSSTTFSGVEFRSSQLHDTAMVNTSSFADSLFRKRSISKASDEPAQNIQKEQIMTGTIARDVCKSMEDVYINSACVQGNQNDRICNIRRKTTIGDTKKGSSKISSQRQEDECQELQIPCHPNKKRRCETQSIVLPCFSPKHLLIAHQSGKTPNIFQEPTTVNKQSGLMCAETISLQDCMKLLELDNSDDERRFREAIERPLTPTLPDIKFLDHHTFEADDLHCLDGEFKIPDNFECSHAIDVIELEISSNQYSVKIPVAQEVIGDDSSQLVDNASEELKLDNVLVSHKVSDNHKALPDNKSNADHGNVNLEVANACSESRAQAKISSVQVSDHLSEELNLEGNPLFDVDLSSHIEGDNNASIKNSASTLKPAEGLGTSQETGNVSKTGSINIQFTDGHEESDSIIVISHESPPCPDTRKSLDLGTGFPFSGKSSETTVPKSVDSSLFLDSNKYMSLSIMGQFERQCEKANSYKGAPSCLVVFSDNSNIDSISRIVQASNSVITEVESEKDNLVVEALHGLAFEVDLQRSEKICVFFSLLLNRICGIAVADLKNVAVCDILRSAQSFATDISRVISDAASRWLFLDICPFEILVNLVEDFLVKRKILICHDQNSAQSCSLPLSSKTYQLKEQSVSLTETDARIDQLVAASVLLAYISNPLDQVGILLEVSYKILRNCKTDVFSNLLVLHLFSFVCGKEFLAAEKHLSAMLIKEVVSLLEKGHHSPPFLPSPHKSLSDDCICFPPCEECPFSKDICGMEKFVCFLMDVLEDITLNGSSVLSNSSCILKDPGQKCDRTAIEIIYASNYDCSSIECDTSCMLCNYRKQFTYMSERTPQKTFCYFTNVVSMLELSACYLNWEWNSSMIVPRLLKMLQSCPDDDLSAGLIVLIGQISRFAVDFVGYEDTEVSKLRLTLSNFLDKYRNEKSSYCKQLAVLHTLVNLLPVTFKEIIDGCIEYSLGANQPFLMKPVKDWFTQLSTEHQVLALGLFE